MSIPTLGASVTDLNRSRIRHRRPGGRSPVRAPVRPIDDGTTELVRVIGFVWSVGSGIQPILWLDRQLLD